MKIADTDRLTLRTATIDDAPFYLALLNDPGFIKHIADRNVRTLDAARDALRTGPLAMQATLGHAMYVVELKGTTTPVGMSGLIKRDALPDVDIGYAFLARYCGQGYGFEAACAVLRHAHQLGIPRIMAITAPDNTASQRVLRKCGLRLHARQRIAPYTTDSLVYAGELPITSHAPPCN
jgi:RimJ/RimL family protein N-acetyltransferase